MYLFNTKILIYGLLFLSNTLYSQDVDTIKGIYFELFGGKNYNYQEKWGNNYGLKLYGGGEKYYADFGLDYSQYPTIRFIDNGNEFSISEIYLNASNSFGIRLLGNSKTRIIGGVGYMYSLMIQEVRPGREVFIEESDFIEVFFKLENYITKDFGISVTNSTRYGGLGRIYNNINAGIIVKIN